MIAANFMPSSCQAEMLMLARFRLGTFASDSILQLYELILLIVPERSCPGEEGVRDDERYER